MFQFWCRENLARFLHHLLEAHDSLFVDDKVSTVAESLVFIQPTSIVDNDIGRIKSAQQRVIKLNLLGEHFLRSSMVGADAQNLRVQLLLGFLLPGGELQGSAWGEVKDIKEQDKKMPGKENNTES